MKGEFDQMISKSELSKGWTWAGDIEIRAVKGEFDQLQNLNYWRGELEQVISEFGLLKVKLE